MSSTQNISTNPNIENHSNTIEIQDSVKEPETCRKCFVPLLNISEHLKSNKDCSKYYFIEELNEHKILLEIQQENMLKNISHCPLVLLKSKKFFKKIM